MTLVSGALGNAMFPGYQEPWDETLPQGFWSLGSCHNNIPGTVLILVNRTIPGKQGLCNIHPQAVAHSIRSPNRIHCT